MKELMFAVNVLFLTAGLAIAACGDDEEATEKGIDSEDPNSQGPPACPDPTWAVMEVGYDVDLVDVWGSKPNDVWATGIEGALFHFDGDDWVVVDVDTGQCSLQTISGRSASDIYTAGDVMRGRRIPRKPMTVMIPF